MAARRRARAREAQVAFEAISIEGGLLSPEWLSRVAQVTAGGQSEADYRIKKGLSLRDEIGRYWRIARAHWAEFAAGRGAADAPRLLEQLRAAAREAARLGLEVHAGHGIDYETVGPVAAIPEVVELNIGHFLIGEAIFIGLGPAIQRMRALMDEARVRAARSAPEPAK